MDSVSSDCLQLKREYDACFNTWFKESFLKGKTEDTCAPLFKVYQACVKVLMSLCYSISREITLQIFFFFFFSQPTKGKNKFVTVLTVYLHMFPFQNAIKQKGIDLWEVERPIIGTEEEKKTPKAN